MPLDKCFAIIEQGAGEDFDPQLAAMFLSAKDQVIKQFRDNSAHEVLPEMSRAS